MLIDSRRKSRMLVPNLRRASSAASSAFWMSLRRWAAATLRRERTVSDSLRASSVVSSRVVPEAPASVAVFSGVAVARDKERVRLIMVSRRLEKPVVASWPTAESSCEAWL